MIPCYRVRAHILGVLASIGSECERIYVVDDACPESSGEYVVNECDDPRVTVVFHERNQGVGGAVLTGYRQAVADGATVIVKVDGDGQMDPAWIPSLIALINSGEADYTKGDRFYDLDTVTAMPRVRLVGNAVLSFLTKVSSGYWDIFDPTNGYTAIDARVAAALPYAKISKRYFFESDMLFRLNLLRCRVVDIPMPAFYGDEKSSMSIAKVLFEFPVKHLRNAWKRFAYTYYVRAFSVASLELPLGILMMVFGAGFGLWTWIANSMAGDVTGSGTVMLAALPTLLGVQLLLAFLSYDIGSVPSQSIGRRLGLIRDPDAVMRLGASAGVARVVAVGSRAATVEIPATQTVSS